MKSDTDSHKRQCTVISHSTVEFMTPPPNKKDLRELTCFVGHSICSSNIHVSHVNTSYGRFPLVQSLNIFVLVSGNP